MDHCEFAISFSALTDHPNHFRLPLWVYDGSGTRFGPQALIKCPDTDWDRIASEKTAFCNFVYSNSVPFRNNIFAAFDAYKRVDSAGKCLNNMGGWLVPSTPHRLAGKVEFMRQYKFTLAIENRIWPGYATEKLVHPMFANSIPIYVGDPLAGASFNRDAYIDITNFSTLGEMLEFVREIDSDRVLYRKMLAAPFYRNNAVPRYAQPDSILAFFDRIFEAALSRT
jgi:hypothetical protein